METGGLRGVSEQILSDLEQRQSGLSQPRREGLGVLVSCMLSEQRPNLMALASALPRQIGSNENRYQYLSGHLSFKQ